MGNGENLEAYAYAGNVAWGFVCCLKTMYNNPSFGNERMFIMDDTPPQSIQALSRPYLESRGFQMTSYYVPLSIMFCICFLVETVCLLISPFKRFSFPLSLSGIIFSTRKFYVRYDKAKTLIGYVPPFSVEGARERSIFIKIKEHFVDNCSKHLTSTNISFILVICYSCTCMYIFYPRLHL